MVTWCHFLWSCAKTAHYGGKCAVDKAAYIMAARKQKREKRNNQGPNFPIKGASPIELISFP
jgi:hypothetical protein